MSENDSGAAGTWSYRQGDWFAVFGDKATVVLPGSQKEQVIALWGLVDGGAGFDEVLDGLLSSGLSRLSGFVLISADGAPTRVLLRGQGVSAAIVGADGAESGLDGGASHTWVEQTVADLARLTVSLPAEGEADGAPEPATVDFPIVAGLVRVGRIDWPAVVPAQPRRRGAGDRGCRRPGCGRGQ